MAEAKQIEIREQDQDLLFTRGMLEAMAEEILSYYGTLFIDSNRRNCVVGSFVDRIDFIQKYMCDAMKNRYETHTNSLPLANLHPISDEGTTSNSSS